MKTNLLDRIATQALTLAAAIALCGTALVAQSNGARTDGQIEMDVVQALDASQDLKNDLITAATIQGQVTLSGTVASDAHKQLAESIASKVAGVTKVNDNLKIGTPGAGNSADDQNAAGATQDNGAPQVDEYPPAANPPEQGSAAPPDNGQQPQYEEQPPNSQEPPPGYPQQPGYGQQPGYPPPPPGYGRRPYNAERPSYAMSTGPITVGQETLLQVRTVESLSDKSAKDGTPVEFTVIRDVTVNGYLAIPRGATVHGVVTESRSAQRLSGTPVLALQLTSLDLGGRSYPLTSDEFRVKGPNKTGHTVGNALGGALIGAIIGGAVGGGGGAAIGAVAGGGAGTAASAAGSPHAWIPAEALVDFHLKAPLTVDPISREEADRLAQGLQIGGPSLYRRPPPYPVYRPYYYYGYGYPYPPVYYRPYYMMGGGYYWR